MANSKIEWTEKTWNVVTGCTKISEGCKHCYAERMSKRLAGRCGYDKDEPFKVTLHPDKLDEPLRWRKPSKIFVCSMGDLFHEDVGFDVIRRIWAVMTTARQHTYMILTKRPERMKQFFKWMQKQEFKVETSWDNIWLGVTAENQQRADERIPILLQIPAAKRFVSVEPMLGPVDLLNLKYDNDILDTLAGEYLSTDGSESYVPWDKLDWVICGGETGQGARPMHPDWVRSLRDQCQQAGTPFFFKSWGDWYPDRKGIYDCSSSVIFEDTVVHHVGKKNSGRVLDSVEWNEYPREG